MSVSYIHHVGSYNPVSGRHVLSLSVALPRTGVSSELHARPAVTQSVFWPRLVAHTCGARQPHLSAAPRPARPRHRASPPALSADHAGAPGLPARPGARGPVPEAMRALPRRRRASRPGEDARTRGNPGRTAAGDPGPPGRRLRLQMQGERTRRQRESFPLSV